jgi:4'-phosphopantetheinyl transferase
VCRLRSHCDSREVPTLIRVDIAIPPLGPGECQVWWATPADARPAHVALLSEIERERREAYRFDADQNRFAIGATLVRLLLAANTGSDPVGLPIDRTCPGCGEPHGRPRLPGSGVEVSVSHSGDRIAVACGRVAAIGVDVESTTRPVDVASLLRRVLSPDETGGPGDFTSFWTRKEAVLKATGDGLNVPMTDVTVTGADLAPALLDFRGRPDLAARMRMATLAPGGDYAAVLAVIDEPSMTVTEHTASILLERYVTNEPQR